MSRPIDIGQDLLERGNTDLTGDTVHSDTKTGIVIQATTPSKIANPSPLGTLAFAATTWLAAMYNFSTRGIHTPNVIVGLALIVGGLTQFMAGMWEFPRGNVYSATVMSLYGAYWMSYATIYIPGSGIMVAYQNDPSEFNNALGMYLILWFIITVLLIPPILHRSVSYAILLATVAITYIMLSASEFTGSPRLLKAGGAFGIITSLLAFYLAESQLLAGEETPFIRLPLLP